MDLTGRYDFGFGVKKRSALLNVDIVIKIGGENEVYESRTLVWNDEVVDRHTNQGTNSSTAAYTVTLFLYFQVIKAK